MFDSGSGDPNAVAREGAVTHSHDGYPAADSSNFGAAEGQMQKDVPRAYLRSASHEVGHTFNQIHQVFEAGSDNSIMTVTPSVADVLAAGGGSFPDDIELAFNETVRRHLKHLPDPAVRPGAMAFFGSAVTAPQADQVSELDQLAMVLEPHSWSVRMGEPVSMRWTLTNQAENAVPVPSEMDPESLVLRINITDPDGNITFLRPAHVASCRRISLISLAPNQSVSGETTVFWGREGFAFTRPGRHTVEVIALWEINGIPVMAAGQCPIWVAFPVSAKDNDIAALLMDEHVGMAVATGRRRANPEGERRIAEAAKLQKTHPACRQLAELGLV
jgi:hypothetical protein